MKWHTRDTGEYDRLQTPCYKHPLPKRWTLCYPSHRKRVTHDITCFHFIYPSLIALYSCKHRGYRAAIFNLIILTRHSIQNMTLYSESSSREAYQWHHLIYIKLHQERQSISSHRFSLTLGLAYNAQFCLYLMNWI